MIHVPSLWIKKGSVNIPSSRFVILNFNCPYRLVARFMVCAVVVPLLVSALLLAQTVGTGSIVGIVTDPQGAVVGGARVAITNKGTAAVIHVTTSAAGAYTSGPIVPGDYAGRVEAKGFKTIELPLVLQVGNTGSGNVRVQIWPESQVVEGHGNAVDADTQHATVQGLL